MRNLDARTRRIVAPLTLCLVALAAAGVERDAWAGPLPGAKPAPVKRAPAIRVKTRPSASQAAKLRWVAAAPEAMLRLASDRTQRGGAEGLAGLAVAANLADRVPRSVVASAFGVMGSADKRLSDEARWVSAELSPDGKQRSPAGLVKDWAIVGPFEDTGGGLDRREGPEDGALTDLARAWDRGAYEVRWRAVPRKLVSASGIVLDAMIAPRQESCTYLASRVALQSGQTFTLHVASTGSVRVALDGADVATAQEVHRGLRFDRIAFKVEAAAGQHVLVVKTCSGATQDDGRVRVRVSDGAGQGKDLPWSADLKPAAGALADAKVQVVRTAMQDAVEVGEEPGAAEAMVAGLVRSMGAADDERTPRVPGLFDRASQGSLTADETAMMGWATPFGADRSGRLNASRELARSEYDAETEAFSQRRLVALRLDSGLVDWAVAATQAEPLASATDTEARLLRAVAAGSLRMLRAPALREIEQIAGQAPETASVWANLAEFAGNFDRELAARAADKLRELEPESDCGAWARNMMARGAQAVKSATARCRSEGVSSADELMTMGQALVEAGALDEARELYREAVQLSPNSTELWQGLSQTSFASARPEDQKAAMAALVRARALSPGEVRLGAEIRLRTREAESDERNLADAAVFLSTKARVPVREGEEADRELYWKRAVEYLPDHRVKQVVHYAREVVIAPRSQADLMEGIPSIEGDTVEILRARVHRASGGIAFAEEQQSEGGRPRVRWSRLDKGDVVEVAVRTFTQGPVGRRGDPPFFFVDYAGSRETHPLLYNEVVVVTPKGQPLAVDVVNGEPDQRTEEDRDGKHVVRMVWTRPVNVPDEPLAPHIGESMPVVMGSTFGSWKEFLDWYKAAVKGFTEPDEQVRRLAAELTKGARTREDKLRRRFNYVSDTIRYVNYVSGEFWLPNRPQQVIARKQGDCDDKAILLITLLKAVGIEAQEVLVQTRMTAQPSALQSKRAAVPLFDHGIAYLPGVGGAAPMWLDATSAQSRLGPLPAMDARAVALFVKDGPAEIVAMPSSSPAEHGVDSTWNITLDSTGAGELVAEERHAGDHGFMLRTNLLEADARAQWVESNLMSGWFSGMKLEGKPGFEAELARGEARVTYKARSDSMVRREGNEWVVPLAPNSTLTSQIAPLLTRKLPVTLPPYLAPSHQSRVIRITAPVGFDFGALPPGGEVNGGEFGSAKLQVVRDPGKPRTVSVTRSVSFDMSTVPVARYAEWRTWLQRVDALMHRGIRLAPKAKGP